MQVKTKRTVLISVAAVAVIAVAAGVAWALMSRPAAVPLPKITEKRGSVLIGKLRRTTMFLHVTKHYDPATVQYAAMDGEPSQNHFFKPTHDEGKVDRDYPAYDAKTFKFLALPTAAIPPQDYYMFVKNGGTLNPALQGTGYKAVDIIDTGHIKILPNLYTGYYDFAWVPLAVMTEYWSGNESMNQELWKRGNDYVIIGASTDGDSNLMVPPNASGDLKSLAGKTVGIMNVSFNTEALLNKKLNSVGLATVGAGGNVGVEMGTPGFVMNDAIQKKLAGCFSWSIYTKALQRVFHYKPLVQWQDLGYRGRISNVVLVVRRDILAKHPDIVQKVVQLNYDATQRAIRTGDYVDANAKRYQDWDNTYMGDGMKVKSLGDPYLDPKLNDTFIQDVYDYMVQCGYFKHQYGLSELVNLSFQNKIEP